MCGPYRLIPLLDFEMMILLLEEVFTIVRGVVCVCVDGKKGTKASSKRVLNSEHEKAINM